MLEKSRQTENDYVIRVHDDLADIDPARWDELAGERLTASPFTTHAYAQALHTTGCATPATGWQPLVFAVYQGKALRAACLVYVKSHSYGEYVFDWAWADAHARSGLRYYPKLLGAIPFTPVTGPRLLGRDATARGLLLQAMTALARQHHLSSAHLLFLDEEDQLAARQAGWLMRQTVQFHWLNRSPQPYGDFADFLADLQRDKRKKIQQERRRVQEAGVAFETARGTQIDEAAWDFFHRCYTTTYREHRSTPYLNREFFAELSRRMPENWLMFTAYQQGQRIAASLVCIDEARRTAFGRYWGSLSAVSCLHFEACYYQPLEWCIAHGFQRFEGGAQGEHKMARGLLPVVTWSAHWLAHPEFAQAVAGYLQQESDWTQAHVQELNAHQPFKAPAARQPRDPLDQDLLA